MNQSKNDAFALLMSAWLLRMRFFESVFLWGSGGTGCCSRDWIGSHRIVSGQYGDISRQLLRQIKCVGRYQDILPAFGCTYSQHIAWPSVFTAWLSDKWLADIVGESIRCESSRSFGTFVSALRRYLYCRHSSFSLFLILYFLFSLYALYLIAVNIFTLFLIHVVRLYGHCDAADSPVAPDPFDNLSFFMVSIYLFRCNLPRQIWCHLMNKYSMNMMSCRCVV